MIIVTILDKAPHNDNTVFLAKSQSVSSLNVHPRAPPENVYETLSTV